MLAMKKKSSPSSGSSNLPVSKQTAGAVTGAVLGGAIAGPVGAVVGAVAGTMMGNRAAKGKSLVSSSTVAAAKMAVTAVEAKIPALKSSKSSAKNLGGKERRQNPKAGNLRSPPPKKATAKATTAKKSAAAQTLARKSPAAKPAAKNAAASKGRSAARKR